MNTYTTRATSAHRTGKAFAKVGYVLARRDRMEELADRPYVRGW